MRFSLILVALVLIAIGLFALLGRDPQQDLADQLARQQIRQQDDVSLDATAAEFHPPSWQLTRELHAVKNSTRETWFVEDELTNTVIQLPFPPTAQGEFPADQQPDEQGSDLSANPGFAGADACAECHQERHQEFTATAHYNTSGWLNTRNIKGPLASTLQTARQGLQFVVDHRGQRILQEVSLADWSMQVPMDIFTGSAKTGQSFLYWHGDQLYQAHVSYMAKLNEWIPSPGFSNAMVDYSRPIKTACLECHITYIQSKRPPNTYHRETAILGISCERCHGPGQQHIQYHRQHPAETTAKHVTHPASLSRQQQLDICAQCHSGLFELTAPAFSYRPGEDLSRFHRILDPESDGIGNIHTSNQLTRLQLSRCFTETEMTCTTCHNPHQYQRGDMAQLTKSCLSCHSVEHCGKSAELGPGIVDQCIDCHMPIADNNDIVMQGSQGNFTMQMTDHHIRVVK